MKESRSCIETFGSTTPVSGLLHLSVINHVQASDSQHHLSHPKTLPRCQASIAALPLATSIIECRHRILAAASTKFEASSVLWSVPMASHGVLGEAHCAGRRAVAEPSEFWPEMAQQKLKVENLDSKSPPSCLYPPSHDFKSSDAAASTSGLKKVRSISSVPTPSLRRLEQLRTLQA